MNNDNIGGLGDAPLHPECAEAAYKLGDGVDAVNSTFFEVVDLDFLSEQSLRFSNARVMARVLMENLAHPMTADPANSFGGEEKAFWLEVANELGADWIAKFRRIGAFMSAVEKA